MLFALSIGNHCIQPLSHAMYLSLSIHLEHRLPSPTITYRAENSSIPNSSACRLHNIENTQRISCRHRPRR